MTTVYLTSLDVEALHVFIMDRTGDAPSQVRDRGLLESAIMRPQMAAHYVGADLVEQAALLATGVSQAHAFVDGNKRTAFIATDVFLRLSNCLFTGDPLEIARQIEQAAANAGSEQEATLLFTQWLRAHVMRREGK